MDPIAAKIEGGGVDAHVAKVQLAVCVRKCEFRPAAHAAHHPAQARWCDSRSLGPFRSVDPRDEMMR